MRCTAKGSVSAAEAAEKRKVVDTMRRVDCCGISPISLPAKGNNKKHEQENKEQNCPQNQAARAGGAALE